MPDRDEIKRVLSHLESYLSGTLLPFWLENAPDTGYGGFLSYFDRYGQPTGETTKPFLMQIRMLYTLSSTHRFGYGGGKCAEMAWSGARFIADHYWDTVYDGWFWIADRAGTPTVTDKVGYGHCFGIYAFSEYFLATGDPLGKEMALRSYDAVCRHMADTRYGGYLELLDRTWRPQPSGQYGGDRKSLDVTMHMMEALTSFYAMSGLPSHRRRLQESIDLILTRMLNPENGLGLIQFTYDFQPLRRIIFATEWGRDARPVDQVAAPIDQTSPGHNVELAWLLLLAADTLGTPRETYAPVVRRLFDHAVEFGIDPEYGGVYADAFMARPAEVTEKQFWQQAEVLIGMLDAYRMFHEETYWRAFRNVYDFVFSKMVVMPSGEWVERVDRAGQPIDPVLGHAWKINYHTVRSMVQTILRLRGLADAA